MTSTLTTDFWNDCFVCVPKPAAVPLALLPPVHTRTTGVCSHLPPRSVPDAHRHHSLPQSGGVYSTSRHRLS